MTGLLSDVVVALVVFALLYVPALAVGALLQGVIA